MAIDQLQWAYDPNRLIPLHEIDAREIFFARHIDQVLEIPADQEIDSLHGADGHMPRIVGVSRSDDRLREVRLGQIEHFLIELGQRVGAAEGIAKETFYFFGRVFHFGAQ